jgi:Na+/glutamate symporter
MVVIPSVLIVKLAELPLTFVLAIVCAPVALYVTCITPVPPGSLSVEFSMTVTVALFHPFALGAGDTAVIVMGGVVSEVNVGAGIRIGPPLDGGRKTSLPNVRGIALFAPRGKPTK